MTDEEMAKLLERYTILSPREKSDKKLLLRAKSEVEQNLGIKLGEKEV